MVASLKSVDPNRGSFSGSELPKSFDSDAILQSLGFGWFQVKFLVFMAYGLAFPQAAIFVYNFLGATIPHRCFIEGCDDIRLARNETPRFIDPINMTTGEGWMGPAILGSLVADLNRTVDERVWKCKYQTGLFNQTPSCAKASYKPGQPCDKGWVHWPHSQAGDLVPIESSITTDFDLVCDDSWKPTFGNFLTLLGLLVGTIFLAPLPDLIGRKKAMGLFTVVMCAFGIGSAFSPNWDGFAGMRFLTGMGGQPALMSFGLWGMEAMAPSMRFGFYCGMAIASAIGNCLTGLAAYLIRDWRTLQLVIFIPFTCTLLCLFFLPESARWLASKKRYEEAKKIFTDAAKLNRVTIPPELLLIPGEESPDVRKDTEEVNLTTGQENTNPFRMFGEILRTPCLLKRVFILFFAWFAQLSLNYGLASTSTNLDNGLGPYVNYVLVMVVDFPSIAIVSVVVSFLGRRIIMNIGLIGGGVSCLIAGLVQDDGTVTVVLANIGKFFATMFATTNYVMTAELFPTPARGITTAAITTAGKIGSIVSPYISYLGSTDPRLPYIIYGAIALFAGLLTLLLPETKDLPMPNTVQDAKDLERTTLSWSNFTFWKKNKAKHHFTH